MSYFQRVQELVPSCIESLPRKVFQVALAQSQNPIDDGFVLTCDDVVWHCRWDRLAQYVEVFESGQKVEAFNTINNSAQTAAKRLVEGIHRNKQMRIPDLVLEAAARRAGAIK